jgi:hypothetical protein
MITESQIMNKQEITFKGFFENQMKSIHKNKKQKAFEREREDYSPEILDNQEEPKNGYFGNIGGYLWPFSNPSPYNNIQSSPHLHNRNPGLIPQENFDERPQTVYAPYYGAPKHMLNPKHPKNLEEDQSMQEALEMSKLAYEEEKRIKDKYEEDFKKAIKESQIDANKPENPSNEEQKIPKPLDDNFSGVSVKSKKANISLPSIKPKVVNPIRASIYPELEQVPLNSENPEDHYTIVKQLATGGSGIIYIGKKIGTEDYVAIKIIDSKSDQEESLIKNEVILTMNSVHPNIIKYLEYFKISRKFWIIEELMSCSLADIILDLQGMIPENIIAYVLKEILQGIYFLHSQKRIHRDIKSDNILINQQGQVKVGDLGFATQLERNHQNRNTFAGTLLWMPPEILSQQTYSMNIDVWSLGIVAFELAHGEPPHYRDGQQRIIGKIMENDAPRLEKPEKWSEEFNDFISKCLVKDPKERANSKELLNHPFILSCQTTNEDFKIFFNEWADNR